MNWNSVKEELLILVFEKKESYVAIGKRYGVSGNAVKKALKKMGLTLPVKRKVNPNEHFNKKEKQAIEKPKKPEIYCAICGKPLIGRQKKYCSVECKRKDYSNIKYHTKYSQKQDEKGLEKKIELIKRMGGQCQRCGYKKNISALCFHHTNSEVKSFELTTRNITKIPLSEVEKEAQKCIVLCHNCHAELHHPQFDNLL